MKCTMFILPYRCICRVLAERLWCWIFCDWKILIPKTSVYGSWNNSYIFSYQKYFHFWCLRVSSADGSISTSISKSWHHTSWCKIKDDIIKKWTSFSWRSAEIRSQCYLFVLMFWSMNKSQKQLYRPLGSV